MKQTIFVLLFAVTLSAQSPRDAYRAAYSDWRQTDPTLERDAANSTQPLVARAGKAAQAAARYKAARTTFLRDSIHQLNLGLAPLEAITSIDTDFAAGRELRNLTEAESKTADSTIKAFAADKDPGIVRLRKALEKEQAALLALGAAQDQTLAATAKAQQASSSAEQSRKTLLESYAQMNKALEEAAEDSDRESAQWSDYYRKLIPSVDASVRVTGGTR
jgi:hypothetical protein